MYRSAAQRASVEVCRDNSETDNRPFVWLLPTLQARILSSEAAANIDVAAVLPSFVNQKVKKNETLFRSYRHVTTRRNCWGSQQSLLLSTDQTTDYWRAGSMLQIWTGIEHAVQMSSVRTCALTLLCAIIKCCIYLSVCDDQHETAWISRQTRRKLTPCRPARVTASHSSCLDRGRMRNWRAARTGDGFRRVGLHEREEERAANSGFSESFK